MEPRGNTKHCRGCKEYKHRQEFFHRLTGAWDQEACRPECACHAPTFAIDPPPNIYVVNDYCMQVGQGRYSEYKIAFGYQDGGYQLIKSRAALPVGLRLLHHAGRVRDRVRMRGPKMGRHSQLRLLPGKMR